MTSIAEQDDRTPDDPPDEDTGEKPGGLDRSRARVVVARALTALAFLLVFVALVIPNELGLLKPAAFVRIPVEALVGVTLLIVLPPRPRRVVAVVGGVLLGLVMIMKVFDVGFHEVLARPFDPVLDWFLLDDAESFLNDTVGRAGAIGAAIAAVLMVIAVLVLTVWAVLRLTRVAVRHKTVTTRAVIVLAVAWIALDVFGANIVPSVPIASTSAAALAYQKASALPESLHDQQEFAQESAVDPYRNTPADQLLTGLRGKDVVISFIESYGRSAVEDPAMAQQVDAVLDAGTSRLAAAGFSAKSGWLTSPTSGGGSWLAHSTLLSGLWIDNQQRFRTLVSSDRLTLPSAFRSASWQTVSVMPGAVGPWPEGQFYGYDRIYEAPDLGYHGSSFSWSTMPDQYTLSAFERSEYGKPNHAPLLAEIPLTSSHVPWAPIPQMIDWNAVGDGSVFTEQAKAAKQPDEVWTDANQVRTEYRRSIEYSLNTLISWVQTYGNDNLVLVFLGDHQPAPIVTGENASRDVPITIVAHDKAVLDKISGWGWQDGLKPGPQAPVWRMDAFRNRFLSAYGP